MLWIISACTSQKRVFLLLSGFLLTVLIDATQNSSGLKYSTVELLNYGASSPILLIMFSDIWGIVGCRNGQGVSHNPCFYPRCNIWSVIFGRKQIYKLFLNQFERMFWQNFPHILRNHIGTKNCACGTKDTFLQLCNSQTPS